MCFFFPLLPPCLAMRFMHLLLSSRVVSEECFCMHFSLTDCYFFSCLRLLIYPLRFLMSNWIKIFLHGRVCHFALNDNFTLLINCIKLRQLFINSLG